MEGMTPMTSTQGLTSAEAALRLKRDGPNRIPITRVSLWRMFFNQFKSAIVILLLIAAAISWAAHDMSGAAVILAIIVVNAGIGFLQEGKAERKLYEVSALVQPTAVVRRDGVLKTIPREDIVVGDLVQVVAGAIAPADLALTFAEGLSVDESTLTGESLPVTKSVDGGVVEMGSVVVAGMGEGTTTAVGARAMLGQIVNLAEAGRPTNFEKEIRHLSELCIGIIVLTSIGLFIGKFVVSPSSALSIDFLIFILAIAIGILPETLPLIATVALSTGALTLSRFGVVVRHLGAIRDFGSITVLCSDKTGTLTENSLKVSDVFIAEQALFDSLLQAARALQGQIADPFQHALAARCKTSAKTVELLHVFPFDAVKRSAEFIISIDGRELSIRQGAYEAIATSLNNHWMEENVHSWMLAHEAKGERVIAFSVKTGTIERLAGLVSFVDPVRATAMHAIAKAKKLGIVIKMISGDSERVCGTIGRQLRLIEGDGRVITGAQWERFSLQEKRAAAAHDFIFARFYPVQKYELIKLLQERNEIVGYMGDGVNDAPSLKLADVGIAVSGATDIAKSSADILLLKHGLETVVHGIMQGRAIFENVSKYLRETLTENLGNFLSISILSLFIPFLPMLPIQILITNLITDVPHVAIATDTVDAQSLKAPKRLHLTSLIRFMIFLSLVSSGSDLLYFRVFHGLEPSVVQSGWFVLSTLAEIASLLSVRSRGYFFETSRPAFFLTLSSAFVVVFVFAAISFAPLRSVLKLSPLPGSMILMILAMAAGYFFVFDVVKRWLYVRWPETY